MSWDTLLSDLSDAINAEFAQNWEYIPMLARNNPNAPPIIDDQKGRIVFLGVFNNPDSTQKMDYAYQKTQVTMPMLEFKKLNFTPKQGDIVQKCGSHKAYQIKNVIFLERNKIRLELLEHSKGFC